YHWLSEAVDDFVREPHNAIQDLSTEPRIDRTGQYLLNMVAAEADANRAASVDLVKWSPDKFAAEARKLAAGPTLFAPQHHAVLPANVNLDRLEKIVRTAHENNPQDFTALLGKQGVGPATIRALSLIAELVYDAPASHRDPAALPPVLANQSKRSWADY